MHSCRQEDRLTSSASENPLVPFASKGCEACVQGPCCSLALLRGEIVKLAAFLFFLLLLAFVAGFKENPCHDSRSLDCFPSDSHNMLLWVCG